MKAGAGDTLGLDVEAWRGIYEERGETFGVGLDGYMFGDWDGICERSEDPASML